jgi:hypothetical protein
MSTANTNRAQIARTLALLSEQAIRATSAEQSWSPAWDVWESWLPRNSTGIVVGVAYGGQLIHHAERGHTVVGFDPYEPYDSQDETSDAPEVMDARYRFVQTRLDPYGERIKLYRQPYGGLLGVDWIFIDGDHRYEAVLRDIREAQAAGIPLIGGHDLGTGWTGVERAVVECLPDGYEIRHNPHTSCWRYARKGGE